MREVIERRRDADGVGEKSRRAGDAEEEQIVLRIVTVRSDHEITRVRDRHPRVSPTMYSSLTLSTEKPSKGFLPNKGTSNPNIRTPGMCQACSRKVPPERGPGTCQSHSGRKVAVGLRVCAEAVCTDD